MRERISRVALIVYVVMLLFLCMTLSAPGDNVLLGLIMLALAIPPVCAGSGKYRVLGALALGVAIIATVCDHSAGRKFKARMGDVKSHMEQNR